MKDDRELLELAAKAAGMDTLCYCQAWKAMAEHNQVEGFYGPSWNPLTDDGDALRLAVKLGMEIYIDTHPDGCACTEVRSVNYPNSGTACVNHGIDPVAATRRAVVVCAALVGKHK